MKLITRFVTIFALMLCLDGCGYAFQGGGSILPPDVRKVQIPRVENESPEPGVSLALTEALRDRFERYGVVAVVEEIGEADAVLKAKILDVKRDVSTTTSSTDTALQSSVSVTVAAELRRVTGPVLWRSTALSVNKTFATTSDVVVTSSADFASGSLGASDLGSLDSREVSRGQEQDALNSALEDVALKIYDASVAPDF